MRSFFPQPMFETADAGGGTTTTTNGAAGQPWFAGKEGVTDEVAGYYSRRGWDKDPVLAALEAGKAHREAEKRLGIPSAELMRIPTKPDDPTWPEVWQRLGTPKDAAGYDLSNVKGPDDKPIEGAMLDNIKKLAHSLNLPKEMAPKLAQAIVASQVKDDANLDAQKAIKLDEERATLKSNWGNNFEANKLIARNAALRLGVTAAELDTLEGVVGYARVFEMMRNVGVRMGEDKFIRNENKPGGGVMSKEEASARRVELMNDKDWVRRYTSGSAAETREMMDLLKLISGQ